MNITQLTSKLLIQHKQSYFKTLSALVLSPPLPDSECNRLLEKLSNQDGTILVAIQDENIVWTCSIYIQQKISKWWVLSAQIEELAVHTNHQWQWIGGKLLEKALEYSRSQGCYKAILNCEEVKTSWYQKFWFEKKGVEMKIYL